MPSSIYIARITRCSEELAKGLQSAGLHVKSFVSGEITADECLLVMTSKAVLANLRPANVTPRAGHAAETSEEPEGVPPPSNMNAHLESQAAIWNRLRTAVPRNQRPVARKLLLLHRRLIWKPRVLALFLAKLDCRGSRSSPESETLQPFASPAGRALRKSG
jgi:hypothetical protein